MVYAYDTELLTYFSLKGFTFSTCEGVVTLHGSLVSVSGDNLGSHAVGGFKGSCTALRPCRHCMVTYNEMKDKVDKSIISTMYVPLMMKFKVW